MARNVRIAGFDMTIKSVKKEYAEIISKKIVTKQGYSTGTPLHRQITKDLQKLTLYTLKDLAIVLKGGKK